MLCRELNSPAPSPAAPRPPRSAARRPNRPRRIRGQNKPKQCNPDDRCSLCAELLFQWLLPPNGLRYLLAGGRGLGWGAGFRSGVGKSPKTPQNPASQVHALLGGGANHPAILNQAPACATTPRTWCIDSLSPCVQQKSRPTPPVH